MDNNDKKKHSLKPSSSFPVVAIGASAGGLNAFKLFFENMPDDSGMAFVLVQHLDPSHKSLMTELLAKYTNMPVSEIVDGMPIKPNHVYMIPPNTYTYVKKFQLKLTEPEEKRGLRLPIDYLFRSMANELGDCALCVVLTGTGADGSLGVREIKGNGGAAFVETPGTAQYDGMPSNAVATGVVDFILPVAEIPQAIIKYVKNTPLSGKRILEHLDDHTTKLRKSEELTSILSLIKVRTNHDFSCYKQGTIERRINRRMGLCDKPTLKAYLQMLRINDDEVKELLKDLLIGVTAFFRDNDAWQAFIDNIINPLVDKRAPDQPIRVWVAGCSTGEEAYTIAMLLMEQQEILGKSFAVQIFASDIDDKALSIARTGLYPESIAADVTQKRLDRFFTKEGEYYRVNKRIRDAVVFASQNLISDPPFSKLDVITCRNLLIYLNASVQRKVISMFHFGLAPDGYLFLGPSESLSQDGVMFEIVNKRWRIFKKLGNSKYQNIQLGISSPPQHYASGVFSALPTPAGNVFHLQNYVQDILLAEFAPAAVVVNRKAEALYYFGGVSEFLEMKPGEPTINVTELVQNGLKMKVRATLQRVIKDGNPVTVTARKKSAIPNKVTTIHVRSLKDKRLADDLFLMTFQDIDDPDTVDASIHHVEPETDLDELKQLQYELVATREDLQSTIEEMETSNEELRASNEEVMSMNEELQSTNEELETSKEELQSLNEELNTVNSQLQDKVSDLEVVNDDLNNLLNSSNIATIFLDKELIIRRFTPITTTLFRLIPTDIGRHLVDIKAKFDADALIENAQKVLTSLQPYESTVHTDDNAMFLCRITPYRTVSDLIQGLVVSFVDVTARAKSEADLSATKERLQHEKDTLLAVMNGAKNTLLAYLDEDFNFIDFNHAFQLTSGYSREYLLGKNYFLFNTNDSLKTIFELVKETGKTHNGIDQPYLINPTKLEDTVYWDWTLSPVLNVDGQVHGLVLALHDTTEKKVVADELRLSNKVFDQSAEGILVTDTDLRIVRVNEAFTTLTGYSMVEAKGKNPSFLASGQHDKAFFAEMWAQINASGVWQGEIWNRRKSGEIYPEWLTISSVTNDAGQLINYVGLFSDISLMKETIAQVSHLASHDELTGLPNKTVFTEQVESLIELNSRSPQRFAVIFLDLDDFKKINDTKGHKFGDKLLRSVAGELISVIRKQDMAARIGGDEFLILINGSNDYSLQKTLTRLQEAINKLKVDETFVSVASSIGVATYPDDAATADELISHADSAMYEAKNNGKNQYHFFSEEHHQKIDRKIKIETGLKKAIESNSLSLHYQPQWDLSSGNIYGMEALLRWTDDELGEVSPAEFIPIAEQTSLIHDVGEWVIANACQQISHWRKQGLKNTYVSINVSPVQFKYSHIPNLLQKQLNKHHVNAKYLTVEITEGALIEQKDKVQFMLSEMIEMGVQLSVDDFGTGYSSLSTLKSYQLHELKIDKTFVDEVLNDDQQAIIEAVIAIGQKLGMRIVAEGIETDVQLNKLIEMGCYKGQGYHLAKPLNVEDMTIMLKKHGQ